MHSPRVAAEAGNPRLFRLTFVVGKRLAEQAGKSGMLQCSTTNSIQTSADRASARPQYWICFLLVFAVAAVYGRVGGHDFVNLDDHRYVTDNLHVQKGLDPQSVVWALTAVYEANWHPLTWLSHMLDVELFGNHAGGHHLTNVLLHICNTLLLFFIFRRATGDAWPSALLAGLFALHPLHVESVAWVSERKDVLSTFFWMLATWFYVGYARRPTIIAYGAVCGCFFLGLMSKPMVVTLPFVLMLMDVWPLNRIRPGESRFGRRLFRLVPEKLPLLLLSAAGSLGALYTQKSAGALSSLDRLPVVDRVVNALMAYTAYILKAIAPVGLHVPVIHGPEAPPWPAVVAAAALAAATFASAAAARRAPYLTVGWFWYLGTLVPVIGLVQVGFQFTADRYTYIPLIGLFIMVSWGLADIAAQRVGPRRWPAVLALSVLVMLAAASHRQAGYWKDGETLFRRALKVSGDNYVARNLLGLALTRAGKYDEALEHHREVLRMRPDYAENISNLGVVLAKSGRPDEAIRMYRRALKLNPLLSEAQFNLGLDLTVQKKTDEAIAAFRKGLSLDPNNADALNNLGVALMQKGNVLAAAAVFQQALDVGDRSPGTLNNLGYALYRQGRNQVATDFFQQALALDPTFVRARDNLSLALTEDRRMRSEIDRLMSLLPRHPEDARTHCRLGDLYLGIGDFRGSLFHYDQAAAQPDGCPDAPKRSASVLAELGRTDQAEDRLLRFVAQNSDDADACYLLAGLYAQQGKVPRAVQWLKKAASLGFDNWPLVDADRRFRTLARHPDAAALRAGR